MTTYIEICITKEFGILESERSFYSVLSGVHCRHSTVITQFNGHNCRQIRVLPVIWMVYKQWNRIESACRAAVSSVQGSTLVFVGQLWSFLARFIAVGSIIITIPLYYNKPQTNIFFNFQNLAL